MERPQPETGRRGMIKNKERVQCLPPGRMLLVPPMVRQPPPPPPNQVKLAAIAVDLNIRLRSADMPGAMQERAFRCTRTLLDATNLKSKKPNPTQIAICLKKTEVQPVKKPPTLRKLNA
ncbi:unnamed protein product [Dovyalis caffra]|uniref:Uncharacterized protein n=1 Tax=Dovyalis caffra TaxID=77055 RepID=A0AAV1STI6_9ROSI|nr:unnamed protein product [Dovyalis caffra]